MFSDVLRFQVSTKVRKKKIMGCVGNDLEIWFRDEVVCRARKIKDENYDKKR